MRGLLRVWIVGVGVACTGVALATPAGDQALKRAEQILGDPHGDVNAALAAADEGLAHDPTNVALLRFKAQILLDRYDYLGFLTAYESFLAAGAKGRNRAEAQDVVNMYRPVRTTALEIEVKSGPAEIYLQSEDKGLFCTAAPSCKRPMLPLDYTVIATRPGFERWTGRVKVESGKTSKLAIALVEKTSQLTVRAIPADAQIRVDGRDYQGPAPVAAGAHAVIVAARGHVEARLEAVAHDGKPVDLDVALVPMVPVHLEPAGATLRLDHGAPLTVDDGAVAIPKGKQVVVAKASGFRDRRIDVDAERPAGYRLDIVLERIPPVAPPPPEPSWLTLRRGLALGAAGVGIAAIVSGAVLWDDSKRLDRYARELCPAATDPCRNTDEVDRLHQRSDRRSLEALLAGGAAAGAAVAAAYLWVTGTPEGRVTLSPRVGAVAGVDLAVRF